MTFSCMENLNGKSTGVIAACSWADPSEKTLQISLSGYLDTKNSNELNDAVLKELKNLPALKTLTVDLSRLSYISSTGIGVLSNIMVHCKKNNVEFFLCKTPDKIKKIMSQLGFLVYFKFKD